MTKRYWSGHSVFSSSVVESFLRRMQINTGMNQFLLMDIDF